MKRSTFVIAAALFTGCGISALAQTARPGHTVIPPSSIPGPTDAGQRAHTNLQYLSPNFSATPQTTGPPFAGYFFETPASLACIYGLQPSSFSPGCNPDVVSAYPYLNPGGGSRAIAIVSAFDDPNAYADLQAFSTQFGVAPITPSSFVVVYAPAGSFPPGSCSGPATKPGQDPTGGWEIEDSVDIEYAHAMAPGATLYLVEAQSNNLLDLLCAVTVGGNLVNAAGGGELSMSFGLAEFSVESVADPVFTVPGVVYFASAGDSPGVYYPSASPNVVSVGGTTVSRNPVTGNFINENVWQGTGGGPSAYEAAQIFQNGLSTRGTPDVAADGNPNTGVWVLDNFVVPETGTTMCGGTPCWLIVGGTSLSSPLWAGITNGADTFLSSSSAEESKLYGRNRSYFNDITLGSCGPYLGYFASPGYDFCSGNGSPNGYLH